MAGMLDKLTSRHAMLLMYLADELPREDRDRLERMLESDADLTRQLERLRELDAFVTTQVRELDAWKAPAVSDEAAARRVAREMRRYQLEVAGRPVPAASPKAAPVSSWWYGAAAVAAAVFLFMGLWGTGLIDVPVSTQLQGMVEAPPGEYGPDGQLASGSGDSVPLIVDVSDLTRTIEGEPIDGLDEARLHVAELEALADAAAPLF